MAQGMDPGEINAMRKAAKSADFEVWEENWDIVEMFLRMQTQWQVGMAGPVGLNYAALEWLCKLYPVKDPAFLFEGVQLMEVTALSCLHKKS